MEAVLDQGNIAPSDQARYTRWATWARQQADIIDPLKNGSNAEAVNEHAIDDEPYTEKNA